MTQPLLSGKVQVDEVTRLKRELAGLETELANAQNELQTLRLASRDSLQVIAAMRQLYQPEFDTLRMLFGEISRVDASAVAGVDWHGSASHTGHDPRWEAWRTKLPARKWKFIEALLDHGEMTGKQLSTALSIPRMTTVYQLAHELGPGKAGLIRKNGDRYALVEL
jgi:ABC-type transporter Mla MlaB component